MRRRCDAVERHDKRAAARPCQPGVQKLHNTVVGGVVESGIHCLVHGWAGLGGEALGLPLYKGGFARPYWAGNEPKQRINAQKRTAAGRSATAQRSCCPTKQIQSSLGRNNRWDTLRVVVGNLLSRVGSCSCSGVVSVFGLLRTLDLLGGMGYVAAISTACNHREP